MKAMVVHGLTDERWKRQWTFESPFFFLCSLSFDSLEQWMKWGERFHFPFKLMLSFQFSNGKMAPCNTTKHHHVSQNKDSFLSHCHVRPIWHIGVSNGVNINSGIKVSFSNGFCGKRMGKITKAWSYLIIGTIFGWNWSCRVGVAQLLLISGMYE